MIIFKRILIALSVFLSINTFGQSFPYQNPNLSSEERAKDLLSRLTLEEKVSLMTDQSDAIPRLGIKKFNWWSEALHGLANNSNVTVFPEPIGMAASFDDELVYKVFNATSDEIRAKYQNAIRSGQENQRFLSLAIWTPNINIFRDPRWGRGPETYGEDPYLTSKMGISVVKGLQGPDDSKYRKLLACAKHFAVHSGPEWSRHTLNVNNISQRELYETYLPAFKSLVQEADVRQVMCAYQRLDDEPCCGNNRLLQRILRDEWGYKYVVVSDCDAISDFYRGHKVSSDATHAAAKGTIAGTDVECAWASYLYDNLPTAIANGLLTEEEIDLHLMRVLEGRFDLGEMDDDNLVPWTKIPVETINCQEHQKLALDMARESMVLLQNNNNLLPLSKSIKKVAVIGPNADDELLMWGSYNGIPNKTSTILDGIKTKLGAEKIVYFKACDPVDNYTIRSADKNCSIEGKQGIKATYWNNRDSKGEKVAENRLNIPFKLLSYGKNEFCPGVNKVDFSGKYETNYSPDESGKIVFKLEVCGGVILCVNGDTISRVQSWKPMYSNVAYPVEKDKKYSIVLYYKQSDNWPATLGFNFGKALPFDHQSEIEKLKDIDVVIFAGGISSELEGEEMPCDLPGFKGGDRTSIELPEVQRNYLNALKKAGKKVILLSCSGSALALTPETQSCDAIVQTWYAGELGGQAIADVLFGDYNPSGKLPVTFYKNDSQLPDFEEYAMKGRTYRYMSDPLFPFGFGLSYSKFETGLAKLDQSTIKAIESVQLTVPVKNTSKRDGTEVIQVYIRKVNDMEGPLKTLRGFKRVEIPAGKTQQVTLNLSPTAFEFYDWGQRKMMVAPGDYEVLYGNSSDGKDLKMVKLTIL